MEYYEKSLSIKIKTIGLNNESVAINYNNIGGVWDSKGNYDKALEYYEKSLSIMLKILGENNESVAITYFNIGRVWYSKGNYDKAIGLLQKAFAELKSGGIPYKIAQCYEALDQSIKALDYYLQSTLNRKEKIGIEDEATQQSIANTKRLAKQLNKENELPDWIKNYKTE